MEISLGITFISEVCDRGVWLALRSLCLNQVDTSTPPIQAVAPSIRNELEK
jgi:hypothetical protein